MSAARRRLGTGPTAPTAQASPTGPRRLPVERAADDRRVDDDQEHAQPGRGRRPLGTGAQLQDVAAVFFYGNQQTR